MATNENFDANGRARITVEVPVPATWTWNGERYTPTYDEDALLYLQQEVACAVESALQESGAYPVFRNYGAWTVETEVLGESPFGDIVLGEIDDEDDEFGPICWQCGNADSLRHRDEDGTVYCLVHGDDWLPPSMVAALFGDDECPF